MGFDPAAFSIEKSKADFSSDALVIVSYDKLGSNYAFLGLLNQLKIDWDFFYSLLLEISFEDFLGFRMTFGRNFMFAFLLATFTSGLLLVFWDFIYLKSIKNKIHFNNSISFIPSWQFLHNYTQKIE